MTAPTDNLPTHKNDFGRVYDLEDPSPYFTALQPSDYRMPAVMSKTLRSIHHHVSAARGAGDTLRVLDFACGYGAVGALLRHTLSMAEMYAWYADRRWQPADARSFWPKDAAFLASRRRESSRFEIGGIDIAGTALEYAAAMGFVDRTFHENLVDHSPSEELIRFLNGVDLVVECGALGELVTTAFGRILDWRRDAGRPWFVYSPRPDVDWAALYTLWTARGYRAESLGITAIRYRKPLGAEERADVLRITRGLGKSDESVLCGDYLMVDLTLARPETDVGNPPIAALRGGYD